MISKIFLIFLVAIIMGCMAGTLIPLAAEDMQINFSKLGPVPIYDYKIINIYPHDKTAYTQGLIYDGQDLYESTGLYGNSTIRKVDLETGKVLKIYRMPAKYFGEGMTIWRNQLVQLTWKSMVGFIYNKSDFTQIGDFYYERDGWGITNDSENLIMSDGSDTLYFMNPDTFSDIGIVKVKDSGKPLYRLNELEFINGSIFANVYFDNRIVIISPKTGEVIGWIDVQELADREKDLSEVDVLNGIAYNSKNDTLLITGKLWPELFEIKIIKNR